MEIDSISSRARSFLSPVCFFFHRPPLRFAVTNFSLPPLCFLRRFPSFLPSFSFSLFFSFVLAMRSSACTHIRDRRCACVVSARSTFSFHLCEYHSNSSLPDRRSNSFILRSRDRVDRFLFHSNLFSLVFNQSPRNSSSFPIVSFIRAALNRVECAFYTYTSPLPSSLQ